MNVQRFLLAAALFAAESAAPQLGAANLRAAESAAPTTASDYAAKAEKNIRNTLTEISEIEATQIPLEQFAEMIKQRHKFEVTLDRRQLADAGVDPAAVEITLSMKGVTVESILQRALAASDLDFTISAGALVITTREAARSQLVTQVYPAKDLLVFRRADGSLDQNPAHLRNLITGVCSPESWNVAGGSGSFAAFNGTISVTQPRDVQREVGDVIAAIRAADAAQKSGDHTPRLCRTPSAEERKVYEALERPIDLELIQMPLEQFAELIKTQAKIEVQLDKRCLSDSGIDPAAMEITDTIKGVPLRLALDRVLGRFDLTYIVQTEVLLITTRDHAAQAMSAHLYPIADFVDGAASANAAAELRKTLIASVDTNAWSDEGGASRMLIAEPWQLLAVSASDATHRKLTERLEQLRVALKQQQESNLVPAESKQTDDPIELHVYALRNNNPAATAKPAATSDAENAAKTSGGKDASSAGIAEVIRETISPESWNSNEGVYLKALPDRLVVRHRKSIHEQVRKLLAQLENPESPVK